jgi:cyclophilin family peptidyl-prolyl cis-trans isomerase
MHRSLILAALFPMITCALVACGNDQPKSGEMSTASKPAESKATESPTAKSTPPASKPAEAKATETTPADANAKTPAASASVPAAADKPAETPKTDPSVDPAIATMREFIASKKIDKTAANWRTKVPMPPKLTFDPKKTYYWLLDTTEGPIKIRLMPDVAPMHVSSTIYLTELGFYDTLKFHRVLKGFMAQGGDPLGTGGGGPAYHYNLEVSPKVKHSKAGILSMANTGMPGSEGSQFFLTFGPTPMLDGNYTVFGETVEGLDTLKKIESFGAASDPTPPSKLMTIKTAKIEVE